MVTDSCWFVFLYPSSQNFGKQGTATGIYTSMWVFQTLCLKTPHRLSCDRKFSYGGHRHTPFSLCIKCQMVMQAEEVLKLLQPVADACGESTVNDVIRYINDSPQWATAYAFMDKLTDIFWVMSLGKRVGIYVNQCVSLFSGCLIPHIVFLPVPVPKIVWLPPKMMLSMFATITPASMRPL